MSMAPRNRSSNATPRPQWTVRHQILGRGLPLWKVLFLAIFVVLMGVPVIMILLVALRQPKTLAAMQPWMLLGNSLLLGVLVTLTSLLIAYGLSWALVSAGLSGHIWARIIWLLPFMTPPYLTSMGWILLMQPHGYLVTLIPALQGVAHNFFTLGGIVMVMSLHLFPIAMVVMLPALEAVVARYDAPAQVHGGNGWYRWYRIWLPITGGVLIGSGLLIFIKAVGEFGTPLVFGSLVHFPVLTTAIYLQITTWPINFSRAADLSLLLVFVVVLLWVVNDLYHRRQALDTVMIRQMPDSDRIGPRIIAWGATLVITLLSIVLPIGSLLVTALLRVQGNGLHWNNVSWIHFRQALSLGSASLTALTTTLRLATLAALLVVCLALALALAVKFTGGWMLTLSAWLSRVPYAVPDVIMAIGLIFFWNATWLPATPYNTSYILVIGYAAILFPLAYNALDETLHRLRPSLWEAALAHQATRWRTGLRIIAPALATPLVSGWMLVFGVAMRDLTIPMFLSPPGITVISSYIYSEFDQGTLPAAMALGVVTLFLTTIVFGVTEWLKSRLAFSPLNRR